MVADLEFAIGDNGEAIDIPLTDADGNTLDTSGYSSGTMTFYSLDRASTLKTITVTIPANGTARWTMTASDTSITLETGMTSRLMVGQIILTGGSSERSTNDFSVYCYS